MQGESAEERKARMHALAKRSADVRRERAAERAARKAAGGQSRTVASPSAVEQHADDLASLQAMIDDRKTLNSDRIRAIEQKQRMLARIEAEEREREHGPLIDLRAALDTLAPHERVSALGTLLGLSEAPVSDAVVSA